MGDGEKKLQSYQMQMLIHLQREDPDEAVFVQCTSTLYPTQTSIHLAIYTWSFFWYITQMHFFASITYALLQSYIIIARLTATLSWATPATSTQPV